MSKENIEVRRKPEQARSRAGVKAILDATAELIGERGSDAVSMTDIARKAKLSKAALYRYFPNKQSVIRQLAMIEFDHHRDSILAMNAIQPADPIESFTRSLRSYIDLHRSEPYRLQLRATIHADTELSALDLNDSRQNATNSADILLENGVVLDRDELQQRILLIIELLDGVLRLVTRVDQKEAKQLLDQFTNMAVRHVFGEESR